MIVAAGKTRGKRLSDAVKSELAANGVSAIAALSAHGVQRVSNAIQRVANETGRRLTATPHTDVIDGRNIMVVMVTYESETAALTTPVLPRRSVQCNDIIRDRYGRLGVVTVIDNDAVYAEFGSSSIKERITDFTIEKSDYRKGRST